MSPREFDGAVAEEVHEHFDADGIFTGRTVVIRGSLWDDASRGAAMRLFEHDRSIDPETGLPQDVAYTDRPFIVHSDIVNFASKAVEKVRAKDREKHKDNPEWFDGRRYIAQPYDPPAPD